jgi:ketosteroid isomerase-like protein
MRFWHFPKSKRAKGRSDIMSKRGMMGWAMFLLLGSVPLAGCTTTSAAAGMDSPATAREDGDQALLALSKQKWLWMAERRTDQLAALFHDQAVFVHMGATMSKAQELDVISGGQIQYKQADIEESSVRIVGDTAIVLNKLRLIAVVGGNEVTNPFVVTEVYVRQGESWKLLSLSFTRLLGQ